MAVNLGKGGKVSLAKTAAEAGVTNLTKIGVGLYWDINRYEGADFDLDAMAFMTNDRDKCPDETFFVFYSNKTAPGVEHSGDERTGSAEGDDETIIVDLTKVPAKISKIYFCVNIFEAVKRRQNFGMVENSGIHIYDLETGTDLLRFDLGEEFSNESAVVVGNLYRHNGDWKFNAIGSGFNRGIVALCANYGIDAVE